MNVVNQYSYALIALGMLGVTWGVLHTYFRAGRLAIAGAMLFIVVLFSVGFVILKPSETNINSAAEAISTVGNGRPTFMFFFSNYCAVCVTIDPIIESIEKDIVPEFNILRIDIHTGTGRAVRREFSFSFTPEFVLFDAEGNEVWRDHIPPRDPQLDLAR